MKWLLENIRNKPEPIKRAVMWTGTFLVMTIIFSLWLLTFNKQTSQTPEDKSVSEVKNELPSVFNSLKSQANLLFEIIKNFGK